MRGTYAYDGQGLQRCKKMANNAPPSLPAALSYSQSRQRIQQRQRGSEEETRAFFTCHHRHVYPSVSLRAGAGGRKDEIAGKKVIEYSCHQPG